jgi:hypothetical protein
MTLVRSLNPLNSEPYEYRQRVEDAVRTAFQGGIRSFAGICRNCRGAFPSEVLSVIKDLQLDTSFTDTSLENRNGGGMSIVEWPEPSPIDYEWRFSPETAQKVGIAAIEFGKRILCLGTPTVYDFLLSGGIDVTLLDRNPCFQVLFGNDSRANVVTANICHLTGLPDLGRFDAVVMDPPWYPEYIKYWVNIARFWCRTEGIVISSMFPELVRPSATCERAALFQTFEALGNVTVVQNALVYETPLFEEEALAAVGIPHIGRWRIADLVTLRLRPLGSEIVLVPPDEEQWERMCFGKRIVGVRMTSDQEREITIQAPYPDGSFVLRSTSRRDPVRCQIGLWTSRNRAAIVTGQPRLSKFLRMVEAKTKPSDAMKAIGANSLEQTALDAVMAFIGTSSSEEI